MNKKVVIIVGGLLLVCCLVVIGITAVILYLRNGDPCPSIDGVDTICIYREPGESERYYVNEASDFNMILPTNWDIDENGTSVELSDPEGKSSINFEAFEDPSFSQIEEITADFCDAFGEGFRSGIQAEDDSDDFQFELFALNGNKGCRAEGSIFEGITQRYYVFFNFDNDKVYSIFYTASDDGSSAADEAGEIMNTFKF